MPFSPFFEPSPSDFSYQIVFFNLLSHNQSLQFPFLSAVTFKMQNMLFQICTD